MNNHKTIHHTSVQIILNYSIFDWARLASRFVTFTTAKKNSVRQQYYQQTYTSILSFVLEISKTVFWHVSLRKMDLFGRSISKRNPLKTRTHDGRGALCTFKICTFTASSSYDWLNYSYPIEFIHFQRICTVIGSCLNVIFSRKGLAPKKMLSFPEEGGVG